jgi:hypothetical protein
VLPFAADAETSLCAACLALTFFLFFFFCDPEAAGEGAGEGVEGVGCAVIFGGAEVLFGAAVVFF